MRIEVYIDNILDDLKFASIKLESLRNFKGLIEQPTKLDKKPQTLV